ncbi:MAG: hypothetical protein KAY46_05865, partial [Burkholderiaceae bacterium]|nr:hypothetical protein [Burkholderiaceae bacterium]
MTRYLPVGRSLRTVLFFLLAGAACVPARAADPVVGADAAAGRLHSWDCRSGARLGEAALPGPLTAPLVVDAGGARVYAAAGAHLRVLSLPSLALEAGRQLANPVTRLALGSGPGGVLLAAGSPATGGSTVGGSADGGSAVGGSAAGGSATAGSAVAPPASGARWTLTAHHPETLTPAFVWSLPVAGEVSALLGIEARRRFVVGFAAHDELWEIAWNPDAPAVLRGLVHDYRSGEAVPLPGRFTERAFKVPRPTRDLAAGGMPFEVLQVDREGGAGIVNLDIRRRTEPVPIAAVRFITAWRSPQARGWLVFHDDGRITRVLAPDARQQAWGRMSAAAIDAVSAPDGSGAIVLEGVGAGIGAGAGAGESGIGSASAGGRVRTVSALAGESAPGAAPAAAP